MTEDSEARVVIGIVGSPFGLKGELKVRPETDYPERYYDLEEVELRDPHGNVRKLEIEGVRFHKGAALVKFAGCDDMDSAEKLRGCELVVPESEVVQLPEDEYFIHEIVGLRVYTTDGRDLGEITEVLRGPANDAYVTEKTIIPALKSVVREMDIAGRKMVVDFPEAGEQ